MVTKMYILVEADQSQHGDPLSRLMTELADQLKMNPAAIRDTDVRYIHNNKHSSSSPTNRTSNISENDRSTTRGLKGAQLNHHSKDHSPPNNHRDVVESKCRASSAPKNSNIEHSFNPDDNNIRAAKITAEACVDSTGRAKAKISVSTNQDPKQESLVYNPHKEETGVKEELYSCGRRNGLDPSPAELRGQRKFEYLPRNSKLPEYKNKCANVKSMGNSDRLSNASTTASRYSGYRSKKEGCVNNVPAARLIKYNTCIKRNNGLQDKCDEVAKMALKSCCKSKK